MASVFTVILIELFFNALDIPSLELLEMVSEKGIWVLSLCFWLIAIFNFIPDYISLLETRIVIKWMSKKATFFRILMLLFLDLMATNIIFFVIALMIFGHLLNLIPGLDFGMTPKGALDIYIFRD